MSCRRSATPAPSRSAAARWMPISRPISSRVRSLSLIHILTTSEVEVLRHISQGMSVTQIAMRLKRSKKTVSTHKRRAMRKLQLSDDLALALYLREKFAE